MENLSDFEKAMQALPADSQMFAWDSALIVGFIQKRLKQLGWTQKLLAEKTGKSEAEISKWFSGLHNMTLRTIAKLEVELDIRLINPQLEIKDTIRLEKYLNGVTNQSYSGYFEILDKSEYKELHDENLRNEEKHATLN